MLCSEYYVSSFSQSYKPELKHSLVIGSCTALNSAIIFIGPPKLTRGGNPFIENRKLYADKCNKVVKFRFSAEIYSDLFRRSIGVIYGEILMNFESNFNF